MISIVFIIVGLKSGNTYFGCEERVTADASGRTVKQMEKNC